MKGVIMFSILRGSFLRSSFLRSNLRPYIKQICGIGCGLVLSMTLVVAVMSAPSDGQNVISAELTKALNMYVETQFDAGIKHANSLFSRGVSASDSIAIYEYLSVCTYAKGQDHRDIAYSYLDSMNSIGPCLNHLPQDFWPRELTDKWYGLMQAKGVISCPDESDKGLSTIAFLPFDNYSVEKHQKRLGRLSSALAEFFAYDFSAFSSLKVVERNKMDYLLKEQNLVKDGRVDKATAIKLGKIIGAKLMVFGLISQFDDKNARMGVKVVNVETSEIIATVDTEGKPDFNRMQKELVEKLAKKLDLELNKETKNILKSSGTQSMDALDMYAQGLEYMDIYDYKMAYEYFKKAYEADNSFAQAKTKMETYWPLVG